MTVTIPEVDFEVDAAMEQLITDLEFARDYIAKHGLAKKQFHSVFTNARCSEGAIMAAIGAGAGSNPRRYRALHALAVTLDANISSTSDAQKAVYDFNDSDDSEVADVIGLFQVAINRLRG